MSEADGADSSAYRTAALARIEAALDGAPETHPQWVARYRIIELIGEGGMGAVYKAEQRSPIERTVALKLIKPGMDSREIVSRFDSERQALAWMDHPNVAKVLDAGTDPLTGRPYFVMEYVPGVPITRFCDEHELTVRQRLDLFTQVCHGIAHAHQKMIVHRDLKPSNILVSSNHGGEAAQVKLIDFGIAKALVGGQSDRTLRTETGQMIGTPEYMSPEQARSVGVSDIDTRSDIYSLGVVLYELLSGTLPFDPQTLRGAGPAAMERIICEQDPPRPSTRLSSLGSTASQVARRRHAALSDLTRQLRGELEWIPLKAIRKDRAHRYATASEVAQDIQNYLQSRPLLAGPESATYRLGKFLRRNKASVAATAAIAVTLIIGIVVSTVLAVRLKHTADSLRDALRETENANAAAQAVNEFLTDDILAGAGPDRLRDKTVRDAIVKEMLDPAAAAAAQRFADKPLIEAAVRDTLAQVYNAIGVGDFGTGHARESLRIRRRILGEDHSDTFKSMVTLAASLFAQGELIESERLIRQTLDARRRLLGDDHPQTLESIANLAVALMSQGRLAEAEPLYRESLERRRRLLGDDHPSTLSALESWAYFLEEQGKLAEAEPIYRDALADLRRIWGDDHPRTMIVTSNLAVLLVRQGKLAEAEPYHREALERRRHVLGDEHPDTLQSFNNLAMLLSVAGRHAEAETLYRDVIDRHRRVLGDDHPDTIQMISNLSSVLQEQGKLSESEPFLREALDRARRTLGDDHSQTMLLLDHLGVLLWRQGKSAEAEAVCREVVQRMRRVLGDEHPQTLTAISNLTAQLQLQGKTAEAESFYGIALVNMRRVLGDDHPDTLRVLNNMVHMLESQGRSAEVLPLQEELYRRSGPSSLPRRDAALFISRYGPALVRLGRYPESEQPLRNAYEQLKSANLSTDRRMRVVVAALAEMCDQTGRADEATRWRAELTALVAATQPATAP